MSTARTDPWRRGATHQASRRSVAAKPVRRSSSGTATIASSPPSSAASEHSDRARGAQVRGHGSAGPPLVGRLWDDAQTLVRGRVSGETASRLAAGALDASAEARRQAEELLRRLAGTITGRLGVASRNELTDLGRRIAALDRRLEVLA